jgi:hypothetical protein
MTYGEAGRALGEQPNRLRYAAPTGRVLIRWDGARQPVIWTVPPPDVDPHDARLEMARRHLNIFGPSTPAAFAYWAGVRPRQAVETFEMLHKSLTQVQTPIGEASILTRDEPAFRAEPGPVAPARLLPSGDAYYLLHGDDRELLVANPDRRRSLWTSRVWPGAILVEAEIVGIWRRSHEKVTIHCWQRLSRAQRDAVETEAASLPVSSTGQVVVHWED